MAHSTRVFPIIAASVFSLALMAGAYALSGPIPFIDTVVAESSEELLRAYAVKDGDSDGLADWQEALYGTDPANPSSFRADLLDGDAANQGLLTPASLAPSETADAEEFPGTDPASGSLTERFSQEFLARYLTTRGTTPPTEEDLVRFVTGAVNELATGEMAMDSYTTSDIRTGGTGTLREYAIEMQALFDAHEPPTAKNELEYLKDAINNTDAGALIHMETIGEAYAALANDLATMTVPPEALTAHVMITNAVHHRGIALGHAALLGEDPILAMLGIGEYTRSAEEYRIGFTGAAEAFAGANLVFRAGEPGYDFYATALRAAATPAP